MNPEPVTDTSSDPSAGDYAKAAVLIIGCAASIAIGFTLIAACHAVGCLNPFRKKQR